MVDSVLFYFFNYSLGVKEEKYVQRLKKGEKYRCTKKRHKKWYEN